MFHVFPPRLWIRFWRFFFNLSCINLNLGSSARFIKINAVLWRCGKNGLIFNPLHYNLLYLRHLKALHLESSFLCVETISIITYLLVDFMLSHFCWIYKPWKIVRVNLTQNAPGGMALGRAVSQVCFLHFMCSKKFRLV